jgi:putative inorganic carbon (HCO3(-)) transporter
MSLPTRSTELDKQKISPVAILFFVVFVPILVTYIMANGNEFRQAATFVSLIVGGIILARPFWGLIFFIGLVYIRPEESIEAIQGMRLPLLVSILTLLATIFHKLINRESFVRSPLNGMMIGFGISGVLSAAFVQLEAEALQDFGKLVILVLLMLNLVTNSSKYRQTVNTLIGFTAYLAIYSIYLYFTSGALNDHGVLRSQATGIFADPNDLAGTIVAGLSFSLFRITSADRSAKLIYVLLSAILIAAILMTNSRGGLLALIVVVGSFLLLSAPVKKAVLAASVCAPLLLILASARMSNFDATEASANSRFWFWSTGVESFVQNPILGVGYKGFVDINGGMTAHNSFVLCFTELGILGYFFWIGCLYLALRKSVGISMPLDRAEILNQNAAKVGLAGFLMAAFWISRTYVPVLYLLVCMPIVQHLCTQADLKEINIKKLRPIELGKVFLICVVSIIVIYIIALRNR